MQEKEHDKEGRRRLKMPVYSVGAGGVSYLIKLKDTPGSYSGNAKKALVVNDGEDAVIFDAEMLALDGTRMMTGDLDMNSHAIDNIDILNFHGFDAAINAYADSIVQLSNKAKTQIISLRLAYLESLTGISIGDGYMIQTDKVRARDGDGLALYEDGGAGIFVKDGGNVGIGLTTPGVRLEVSRSGSNVSLFRVSASSGVQNDTIAQIRSGASDAGYKLFSIDHGAAYATNVLTVRGDGHVGIGQTNPGAKLQVTGAVDIGGGVLLSAILGSAYNHWTCFGSVDGGRIRGSSSGYLVMEARNGSESWVIFRTGDSERVRIIANGNVGIGTTGPEEKLQLGDYSAPVSLIIASQNAQASGGGIKFSELTNFESGFFFDHDTSNNKLHIQGWSGGAKVSDAITILRADGNVGIGTASPGAKLDVNGDAKLGGDLNMGTHTIKNVTVPTTDYQAAPKKYVDDQDVFLLPLSGTRGMTGDLDMNNNHINEAALDVGDLDNQEYRGFVLTSQIAGESLSFGNLVYHASDNRYNKTDADTISKTEGDLAIVLTTGTTAENGYVTILKLGSVKNTSWSFTIGAILYVSQTAGAITATEPSAVGSFSRKIGYAQASNIVYFNPSHTILENG